MLSTIQCGRQNNWSLTCLVTSPMLDPMSWNRRSNNLGVFCSVGDGHEGHYCVRVHSAEPCYWVPTLCAFVAATAWLTTTGTFVVAFCDVVETARMLMIVKGWIQKANGAQVVLLHINGAVTLPSTLSLDSDSFPLRLSLDADVVGQKIWIWQFAMTIACTIVRLAITVLFQQARAALQTD
jgi:hypothetical protein